ncbi:MAG: hypothetical protein C0616_02365 [Desulfuromonas sp.]|nr:MAG: hypothetical protein C0616_02365 [Desulfuromonas sp.]
MKRHLILVVCLTLFLASQAWAGQFGPITSRVQSGQFYLGGGYMNLTEKLDAGDNAYNLDGKEPLETRQNSLYLQAGVGIGRGWEGYIRGGVSDFQVESLDYQWTNQSSESSSELRPFFSAGIGGPAFSGPTLSVGPFVQVSYYSDYEDEKSGSFSGNPGKEKFFFDNAINVDLGFTFETVLEGAVLYGGPIVSFYDSKIKSAFYASDSNLGTATEGWHDLKLDSSYGGFFGINWPLNESLQLNAEGQYRSGLGIGGNLIYTF